MENVKQFLEFPLDNLPSNFNASEALYKLWPSMEKRPLGVYSKSFPRDAVAGDVGVLEVGTDGVAGFRRLANIGDLFGGVRFALPRTDLDHPTISRWAGEENPPVIRALTMLLQVRLSGTR